MVEFALVLSVTALTVTWVVWFGPICRLSWVCMGVILWGGGGNVHFVSAASNWAIRKVWNLNISLFHSKPLAFLPLNSDITALTSAYISIAILQLFLNLYASMQSECSYDSSHSLFVIAISMIIFAFSLSSCVCAYRKDTVCRNYVNV